MNRTICIFLFPAIFVCLFACSACKTGKHPAPVQPKSMHTAPPKTLAILPFENNSVTNPITYDPLQKGLAAMLTGDLKKGDTGVQIIERAKIAALLKEIALGQTGSLDTATAVKAGRILGAQSIAIGAFTVLGNQVRMDCRIIKVETSEILMAESITGSNEDFLELERKLAQNIATTLHMALHIPVNQGSMDAALLFSQGVQALDSGDRKTAEGYFDRCRAIAPAYTEQINVLLKG